MIPGDRAQKSRAKARIRRKRYYDKETPEMKQRRRDWIKAHPGYNSASIRRKQEWCYNVTKQSAHRDGVRLNEFDMQHILRDDISCMAIALLLGRTYPSVIQHRFMLRHSRPKQIRKNDNWRNAKRQQTKSAANKNGMPWTNAELKLLWQNPNGLSNAELALVLGRSYDSICQMKYKRGLRPSRAVPGAKEAANKKMLGTAYASGKRTPEQCARIREARWGKAS